MELTARDIMSPDFDTIRPDASVSEAVKLIFKGKIRSTGYKNISIMVTNELGTLVGVISMLDILYHLRPAFMNYEMDSSPLWEDELEPYIERFKNLTVEQIMSSPVITVLPETQLMVVIDLMVKKKGHRIPVVEEGRLLGVVYLSEVFHTLCRTWLE